MKTIWGEGLDVNAPLSEYPRPQMVRDSYISLNGAWDFEADGQKQSIVVPFSPECELSGVNKRFSPDTVLHYSKRFTLPVGFNRGLVLLHFDAVDCMCTVKLNGTEVGCHFGGYWPFTLDVTHAIEGENLLELEVTDPCRSTDFYAKGKQKRERGGIWYTQQSGIWQSVWLESVPETYIRQLRISVDCDYGRVRIIAFSDDDAEVIVDFMGMSFKGECNSEMSIPVNNARLWSPEDPFLYDFTVTVGEDRVQSYFAMRKFQVGRDERGIRRLMLNGKPYFQSGVLDQGYWQDGMLTPPSDEAMIFDIQTMKDMGFNMLRKHIKIEPLRWYYHCDRLGMLVWQDIVNGGTDYHPVTVSSPLVTNIHSKDDNYRAFGRETPDSRALYQKELWDTILLLYNCPCICTWVLFNEGWGQFDALAACSKARALDPSRFIDHASGWHDQGGGDMKSWHTYFTPYVQRPDRKDRPVVLSEFGGYNLRVAGHCFGERDFGYRRFGSEKELANAITALYEEQIIPAKSKGLCASVYTQLSDVEDELNGLVTYDRRFTKLPQDVMSDINGRLKD